MRGVGGRGKSSVPGIDVVRTPTVKGNDIVCRHPSLAHGALRLISIQPLLGTQCMIKQKRANNSKTQNVRGVEERKERETYIGGTLRHGQLFHKVVGESIDQGTIFGWKKMPNGKRKTQL